MTRVTYSIVILIAVAMVSGCAGQKKAKTATQLDTMTIQETVLFDFNQSRIRDDGKPILNEVAQKLKANPSLAIVVEGHTDCRGSTAYNELLAEKRARAVGAYLSQSGVPYQRITFISKGKRDPKDPRHTQEANRVNRRTEIYNH